MTDIIIWGTHSSIGAELANQLLLLYKEVNIWIIDDTNNSKSKEAFMKYIMHHHSHLKNEINWINIDYTESGKTLTNTLNDVFARGSVKIAITGQIYDTDLSSSEIEYFYLRPLQEIRRLTQEFNNTEIIYFSSLFLAGDRTGAFTEYDLNCNQLHRNSFERVNYTAEKFITENLLHCKMTIYRLPLVSCHSQSGNLIEIQSLFHDILSILKTNLGAINGDDKATLAIAPVDHIVDLAIKNIFDNKPISGTFHITGLLLSLSEIINKLDPTINNIRFKTIAKSTLSLSRKQKHKSYLHRYFYPGPHFDNYRYERLLCKYDCKRPAISSIIFPNKLPDKIKIEENHNDRKRLSALHLEGVFEIPGKQERVIENIKTEYWDNGHGHGPTIIFLSGVLGPESYFSLCKKIEDQYRCITTGLVGISNSTAIDSLPVGLNKQASLIKGLLSSLNIQDKCHFVTSDIASSVISYFQSRWPDKIASITYLNPAFKNDDINKFLPLSPLRIMRFPFIQNIARITENKFNGSILNFSSWVNNTDRRSKSRLDLLRKNINSSNISFKQYCFLLSGGLDQINDESKIYNHPLQMIWSCDNKKTSLSYSTENIYKKSTVNSINLIPHSGIDVYEEMPDIIANKIINFMSK